MTDRLVGQSGFRICVTKMVISGIFKNKWMQESAIDNDGTETSSDSAFTFWLALLKPIIFSVLLWVNSLKI